MYQYVESCRFGRLGQVTTSQQCKVYVAPTSQDAFVRQHRISKTTTNSPEPNKNIPVSVQYGFSVSTPGYYSGMGTAEQRFIQWYRSVRVVIPCVNSGRQSMIHLSVKVGPTSRGPDLISVFLHLPPAMLGSVLIAIISGLNNRPFPSSTAVQVPSSAHAELVHIFIKRKN